MILSTQQPLELVSYKKPNEFKIYFCPTISLFFFWSNKVIFISFLFTIVITISNDFYDVSRHIFMQGQQVQLLPFRGNDAELKI